MNKIIMTGNLKKDEIMENKIVYEIKEDYTKPKKFRLKDSRIVNAKVDFRNDKVFIFEKNDTEIAELCNINYFFMEMNAREIESESESEI